MKKVRTISRVVFVITAVWLLVYLNGKTNDDVESVAHFKFKMIEKMRTDSLDSKQKFDLLLDDTERFVDNSVRVKDGMRYLTNLLGLFLIVELVFLFLIKKNQGKE